MAMDAWDAQDAHPNSNMSETIIIGGCDTGVSNQFVNCGTTMMDQIEDVIANISLEYNNGNWDYLHKKFMTKLAQTTYYWRKDRLITATERSKISSCTWQIKSNFDELIIKLGDFEYLQSKGITVEQFLDSARPIADLLNAGTTPSNLYGKLYQGGLIFYINTEDGSGLVAALSNQQRAQWGCNGVDLPGALGTSIGSGAQNTIDILAGCSTIGTAAYVCSNLTLGGFSDWFLPSKDEVTAMRNNLHLNGLGNFPYGWYWSSSEFDSVGAWYQYMDSPSSYHQNQKNNQGGSVRAVRAF